MSLDCCSCFWPRGKLGKSEKSFEDEKLEGEEATQDLLKNLGVELGFSLELKVSPLEELRV